MVETTSNVEKIRFLRLNQVFDRALEQSLVRFQDWDKFSSSFPTYSKTKDGVTHLANCQKQVTEFFTGLSHKEFDALLADRHVEEKLDELDELIAEANVRLEHKLNQREEDGMDELLDVPISELTPDELLDCSIHTQRQDTINKLDERLDKLQTMNEDLLNEIKELEKGINDDIKEIKNTYSHFFGDIVLEAPDKEVEESLHDMLVQKSEYKV